MLQYTLYCLLSKPHLNRTSACSLRDMTNSLKFKITVPRNLMQIRKLIRLKIYVKFVSNCTA